MTHLTLNVCPTNTLIISLLLIQALKSGSGGGVTGRLRWSLGGAWLGDLGQLAAAGLSQYASGGYAICLFVCMYVLYVYYCYDHDTLERKVPYINCTYIYTCIQTRYQQPDRARTSLLRQSPEAQKGMLKWCITVMMYVL